MVSIAEYNKSLTPEQRSENSRRAALSRVEKERAKKVIAIDKPKRESRMPIHELASLLGRAQIQKGIPLPEKMRNGLQTVYTPFFDKFQVDDCTYFDDAKLGAKIYAAAQHYGEKYGKTFASRTEILPDGRKRNGIWRIK